ncbi:aspartate--tRNA ligase [Candidatus Kaiserbacteria bacterium CG10_big_fil_rev_8_21_14_0_10_59_10]|uniref:Aspartate--tRNA ligase n=1 Tax=Candidatus Kaiserbacteria bacterium CG10_big_fil_rev_8_21_14_0_10_59_10 TaxID=1974612 RepID=A0A2H0U767_9BACT|nr:MAG: aspartate--tRNA ligase [Candidatus Kaiserbacteria bacterium CG10_big_fil_rev_8_21_14_0_10_59_10]
MERTLIKDLRDHVGKTVTIMGWVSVRRDQGKMVFLDIRDATGSVQTVVLPKSPALDTAKELAREFVVEVEGEVSARPAQNVNSDVPNGDIEVAVSGIQILNSSETPPFDITVDTAALNEEVRLKYRYVDLRSERMQRIIRLRSEFVHACREFLHERGFVEIETPLLTESTPEGSRDFVVPSRLHKGKFYALPQSPQQYKQLLMAGGFERYFQLARAVRDEDLRSDRGFEHTQIDIEMSFVEEGDVMRLIEEMVVQTAEQLGRHIAQKPFPRFTFADAMERFGTDKFDMRTEEEKINGALSFAWVYRFPFFEQAPDGQWTFTHNPFSAPIPEHAELLLKKERIGDILTAQYDLVCNGFEVGGGSIRAHRAELLRATYEVMGHSPEEIESRVGHMLKAFSLGTPPHGGIALGVERLVMTLAGEEHLREVQAFPMTRGGQTSVMSAPKELSDAQLQELGITFQKPPRHE